MNTVVLISLIRVVVKLERVIQKMTVTIDDDNEG